MRSLLEEGLAGSWSIGKKGGILDYGKGEVEAAGYGGCSIVVSTQKFFPDIAGFGSYLFTPPASGDTITA